MEWGNENVRADVPIKRMTAKQGTPIIDDDLHKYSIKWTEIYVSWITGVLSICLVALNVTKYFIFKNQITKNVIEKMCITFKTK